MKKNAPEVAPKKSANSTLVTLAQMKSIAKQLSVPKAIAKALVGKPKVKVCAAIRTKCDRNWQDWCKFYRSVMQSRARKGTKSIDLITEMVDHIIRSS